MNRSLWWWIGLLAITPLIAGAVEHGHVFGGFMWAALVFWQWAEDLFALRPGSEHVADLRREIAEEREARRRMRAVIDRAHAVMADLAPRDMRVVRWIDAAREASAPPLPHVRDRRHG